MSKDSHGKPASHHLCSGEGGWTKESLKLAHTHRSMETQTFFRPKNVYNTLSSQFVWAGRKPINGRQCIFLITRILCEFFSLQRTGNKLIYSCTHMQIFCLFKQPKRLVTGLLTHKMLLLQRQQQHQYKILSRSQPPRAAFALNKSL